MKFLFFTLLLSNFAFPAPVIVPSPIDHLYIPEGFDSNDSVEVVVTGLFPNTCYSRNQVEVRTQGELIDITVTALAPDETMKRAKYCAEMVVPFKEVVALGNLQGGHYKVQVNHKARLRLSESLTVREASSSAIDESIYGAIEWVEQKSNGEYLLHGLNYSPCFVLDEIRVVSNQKDTLSILPIMKQISTFCPMKGVFVTYPVRLDLTHFSFKKTLLHVRTLDGKSINTIVENQ